MPKASPMGATGRKDPPKPPAPPISPPAPEPRRQQPAAENTPPTNPSEIRVERVQVENLPPVEEPTPADLARQAEAQKGPDLEAQKLARKRMIRMACNLANVGIVSMTQKASKGLLTNEAALTEKDIALLEEVWESHIPTVSPIYVAIFTTVGIVGQKVNIVRVELAKKQKEIANGTSKPAPEPSKEQGSEADRVPGEEVIRPPDD